ncbi:hypothetical protein [Butyrivibrio hungatei]|uniref:hypothetical protein n=1 Tax=Butyrivibrio hungatei TaxID=185008 RepID=UPI00068586B1|nr:hypothetical protein [Butyrivibrio hungatei]
MIGLYKSWKRAKYKNNKMQDFYYLLLDWLKLYQSGKSLESYLLGRGYVTVAIYGMKELGIALLDELKMSKIEVKYAIDRDADNTYAALEIYKPNEKLENVDAIIVTAVSYFDEIKMALSDKISCDILSLDYILKDALNNKT